MPGGALGHPVTAGTRDDSSRVPAVLRRLRPVAGRRRRGRIVAVLAGSRRAWWIAAALAATALGALMFVSAPGSIKIVAAVPADARFSSLHSSSAVPAGLPGWARPCLGQVPDVRQPPTAFCARVDGRVIGSFTKSEPVGPETHLLVTGGFHVTLVELRPGTPVPSWGSHIVAVGPLAAEELGLRELKAVSVGRG